MFTPQDEMWMNKAIELAEKAASIDEVPVGAVLVLDDVMVGSGHNCPLSTVNPTAHAEMMAIKSGAEKIGNYRLLNATLYVTLEPCLMCAGAMVHARIKRLVYGATEPKTGVISTWLQALDQPFLNHRIQHAGGLCAEKCGAILSQFFQAKR